MTNDTAPILTGELLPVSDVDNEWPLTPQEPMPDSDPISEAAPPELAPDIAPPPADAAEIKDQAAVAPGADKRAAGRRIATRVLSVFCAAVFALSMYAEASAYFSGVTVEALAGFVASASFGGDYAVTDGTETSEPDSTEAPETETPPAETASAGTADAVPDESTPPPAADGGERFPIVIRDFSAKAERGLACANETGYKLDLAAFADGELALPPLSELDGDGPVVLIVHTHGTESYAEGDAASYCKGTSSRTDDTSKNVVAVGDVIAEYFEAHGIRTLHCREMFDLKSYADAYEESSAAVREYLAIYPSIKYVFDVHRDSLIDSDGTKYRPLTVIDGVPTAQVMCVVGTDDAGSGHTGWHDNLTFAAHLQSRLWSRSNTLPRVLSIRSASFYQQYSPGSLLLEIGSCGNTLEEAKAAAEIVAEELAGIIKDGK